MARSKADQILQLKVTLAEAEPPLWLIKALADPDHDEHDQMVTWVGWHFDPDSFDANAVNRLLRGGR